MNEEVKLTFKNSVTGQEKLDRYYKSLSNINTILGGATKGANINISNQMDKNTKSIEKFGGAMQKAFNLTALIAGFKKFINIVSKGIEKTSSYIENLNALDVAFNNQGQSITKYINQFSEMYNLDESAVTKTVGQFKLLANAMKIPNEEGTKLSKMLNQLALDTSSLFNISYESAVTKLTSGLSGQTKAVRTLGIDITETSLQQELMRLGIERNIDTLTYAEKRLIIVSAMMDQASDAQNDFGRTSESLSNQMKILNEQWSRLSRAIGNVFFSILKAILPYLNAVLMVLTEIINTIATLLGFSMEGEDYFGGLKEDAADFEEELNKSYGTAKKLKSGLRGFDKLNVITTPSAGAGGGTPSLGIDQDILDAFNKAFADYDSKLQSIQTKATKIRDIIMEWLGFTKIINEETGKVEFTFEEITSGTVLGSLGVGGIIYGGIASISKLLAKFGIISKPLPSLFTLIWKAIKGIVSALGAVVSAIAAATGLSVGWVIAIAVAVAAVVALIIIYRDEIANFFVELWNSFNENVIQPIANFVETIALWVWDNAIKPIIDFFAPIVDAIVSIFKTIFTNIAEIVVGVGKAVWSILSKIGEIFAKIIEIFVALGKALYDYVIKPVFEFVGNIAKSIWNNAIKPVIDFFVDVGSWAYNKIIKPIWDKVVWIKDKVVDVFKTIGITVVNFIGNLFKSVINGIFAVIEGAINFFIKALNAAINLINEIPGVDISKVELLKIPRLKVGMDFVPNDFYGPVYLDYGERVLTKEENKEYSKNKGYASGMLSKSSSSNNNGINNATFVIQVGDKEIARTVLDNLQDMAKSNGKPITIGG